MKLHALSDTPTPSLGQALAAFEETFTYPLGVTQRFRISHGEAYLPFFQAIGDPLVLAAERDGEVLGTLACVRRRLEWRSDAASPAEAIMAHYLCDLKLRAASRGSMVLARLIRETKRGIEATGNLACYCVVMEGTGRLPTDYTGRLGVPRFEMLGEIVILRLSSQRPLSRGTPSSLVGETEFSAVQQSLPRAGYVATGGNSSVRSLMAAQRIVTDDRQACGMIEDTRRGKRLFLEAGSELRSAHLSGFACATPQAGAALLRDAVARAADEGIPAVFTALPRRELLKLLPGLGGLEILQAPAVVYGHALKPGCDWWIDTAEI